jgi:GntR family carbon starvation induced transcriptional regulator
LKPLDRFREPQPGGPLHGEAQVRLLEIEGKDRRRGARTKPRASHANESEMAAKTQSEQTYDSLRADILACHLEPGGKLRINEIAEAQGVSLGAVREALSRLGAEGLVVPEAQKGYSVSPLSIDELLDLTEARVEIERIALMRSVERGDLDWETSLVATWHRLGRLDERALNTGGKPPDPELSDQWAVAHSAFHKALVQACGSETLLQIRFRLYELAERYRRYSAPIASEKKRDVHAEHQAIFDAAVARNAPLAGQLISEHLRATASLIVNASRLAAEEAVAPVRANVLRESGRKLVRSGAPEEEDCET